MDARAHALEVRNRLRHPPNGRQSSELEILAPPRLRDARIQRDIAAANARRTELLRERVARAAEMVEAVRAARAQALEDAEAERIARAGELGQAVPTLKSIIEEVARRYHVQPVDILSDRRDAPVVLPRHIAMYLGRRLTLLSLAQIGRRMGGKDHTTVIHAVDRITCMVENFPHVKSEMESIMAALSSPVRNAGPRVWRLTLPEQAHKV